MTKSWSLSLTHSIASKAINTLFKYTPTLNKIGLYWFYMKARMVKTY